MFTTVVSRRRSSSSSLYCYSLEVFYWIHCRRFAYLYNSKLFKEEGPTGVSASTGKEPSPDEKLKEALEKGKGGEETQKTQGEYMALGPIQVAQALRDTVWDATEPAAEDDQVEASGNYDVVFL